MRRSSSSPVRANPRSRRGAVLDQQACDIEPVAVGGRNEARRAAGVASVDSGAAVEQ